MLHREQARVREEASLRKKQFPCATSAAGWTTFCSRTSPDMVGLHPKSAKQYTDGLIEQGYETPGAFDALSIKELRDDFGFKKGHLLLVEKYRADMPPVTPQVAEYAEPTLPGGLSVRVHMERKLGQGGGGVVYKGLLTRRSSTQPVLYWRGS